jgi:hypothetical protein
MGCGSLRTKDSHNTKPSSEVNSACLRLNNELYRITKVQLGIKSKYLKFSLRPIGELPKSIECSLTND